MVKKTILSVLNTITNFYKLIHVIKMTALFIILYIRMKKRIHMEKKVTMVKRVAEVKTA